MIGTHFSSDLVQVEQSALPSQGLEFEPTNRQVGLSREPCLLLTIFRSDMWKTDETSWIISLISFGATHHISQRSQSLQLSSRRWSHVILMFTSQDLPNFCWMKRVSFGIQTRDGSRYRCTTVNSEKAWLVQRDTMGGDFLLFNVSRIFVNKLEFDPK
jgi:hypothetical protein